MKILKLSAYYEPEKIASSHLTKDLEEAYINSGFTIKIVTPTPSRTVDKETRNKYKKIKYETKYDGKIEIIRFRLFREYNNVILRALRYLISIVKQYFIAKKFKDIDIIISGSTPPIQGLLVSKLKKKLKVPMIYVLQDIFPDSLLNTGIINRKGIIWKIGRKIEDYTYNNSDKIIVISEGFKENIMNKGVPERKIKIVPNWININNIKHIPRAENYIFDKYKIDRDKFIVSYCGNLGLTQNLEMVISSAKNLESIKDLLFVFVGEGKNKDILINLRDRLNLSNIMFIPFQPESNISEVFSIGDLGLIVSKPNIGSNSVPSKLFTMMAASQPILASFDLNSDLNKIIEESSSGICIAPGDKELFIDNIINLKNNITLLNSLSKESRSFVRKYYSTNTCVNQYVQQVSEVLNIE